MGAGSRYSSRPHSAAVFDSTAREQSTSPAAVSRGWRTPFSTPLVLSTRNCFSRRTSKEAGEDSMFQIGEGEARVCEGRTRREWLRVGALGAAGLALPELLAARATAAPGQPRSFGRAKSCILAFLFGAPGHQDLWDLKPDAPAEYRGEFRPIRTSQPDIEVCELLPRTARQAHHLALVRSVTHPDDTHTVAMHYMLTGHRHAQPQTNPQNKGTDFPCFGAAMRYLRPSHKPLPSGISLNAPANQVSANNHIFPGFFAGFLGSQYDPLFLAQDPSGAEFRPFDPAPGLTVPRLSRRRGLLEEVDARWREAEPTVAAVRLQQHLQKAMELTTSAAARESFRLTAEPEAVRKQYGMHPFGQGLLLARRLVEAGVGLVTVNWMRDDAFWDTHSRNFSQLRESLLPPFDQAFAALVADLHNRGLLDETLVVCLGEFGRTPKINANAGRDHWAACNTVVLA
ncbi:MAG: DUF1501 domain-containing protein, partial [Armatimonadetes bacterium]|nr:DUF1501 domain-containing protein [Armatimonadota bacterium]